MIAIDGGKIEAMVAQMRNAVSSVKLPNSIESSVNQTQSSSGVDFAQIFKSHLEQTNQLQQNAQQLGQKYTLGDSSVNLSDVMIGYQKSSIALQTTVQIRNRLVSAYHDIMNMQV